MCTLWAFRILCMLRTSFLARRNFGRCFEGAKRSQNPHPLPTPQRVRHPQKISLHVSGVEGLVTRHGLPRCRAVGFATRPLNLIGS